MTVASRTPTATLVYNAVPPSLNTTGTRGSHWKAHRAKKQWQETLGWLLIASELPCGLESVEASAILRFPVQRRRDEGNFRWLLEKALGDALVDTQHIADDTPDRYRFFGVEFDQETGPAQTTITIVGRRP